MFGAVELYSTSSFVVIHLSQQEIKMKYIKRLSRVHSLLVVTIITLLFIILFIA